MPSDAKWQGPAQFALRSVLFLTLFTALFSVYLFLGKFVDAPWDKAVLLFLNPDVKIPVLDQLVILETDFATYWVAISLIAWTIGYYSSRGSESRREKTCTVMHVLGVLWCVWHLCGLFVWKQGIFWWSEPHDKIVFVPLALAFYASFRLIGLSYVRLSDETQQRLAGLFWMTIVAVIFTNMIGEDKLKSIVQRHRPLHESYAPWNEAIRILPDEVVRGSYSYISGHASSFFALVTAFAWAFKSWKVRTVLWGWAAFHAFNRIYTAAHWPYDTILGALFGFIVASMVYFIFRRDDEGVDWDW